MNWYIPSFHGDFRFTETDDKKGAALTAERPTPAEVEAIQRYLKRCLKENWITARDRDTFLMLLRDGSRSATPQIVIEAPLAQAAAPMAKILGRGKVGLVTALAFEDGKVKLTEVVEESDLPRWMRAEIEVAKAPPRAAVTVARPKLSCPECSGRPEGERKACDVLWDFLDADQRREWLSGRRFTAFGSHTGHAYDVAPRDTARAADRGRICFDMDDGVILHNFDLTLPPEEEALQAQLILEHRANWIRVAGEVDPVHRATPGTVYTSPLPLVYN